MKYTYDGQVFSSGDPDPVAGYAALYWRYRQPLLELHDTAADAIAFLFSGAVQGYLSHVAVIRLNTKETIWPNAADLDIDEAYLVRDRFDAIEVTT